MSRGTHTTLPAQTWLERFPARDLNRRLPELKQARKDGWELTVLIAPGSREIVVAGWYPAWPEQLQLLAEPA